MDREVGCPSDAELDAYLRANVEDGQRSAIEDHLSGCVDCRRVVAAAVRVSTASPNSCKDEDAELPPRSERYEWDRPIGEGAMGVVYRAYDRFLDRDVAIKVVRSDAGAPSALSRRRLLNESRALARVTHPNIVAIHDVGIHDDGIESGELFIAMELVRGVSVRQWLAAGPRSWREILDVFDGALAGLAAVHAAGIVHRDFKPDNVLVDETGVAKVTDFGLVRGSVGTSLAETPTADPIMPSITRDGDLVGTPTYMAPELFRSEPATPQSDQFAACVSLYEALYGHRPFDASTLAELAERVIRGDFMTDPRASVPRRIFRVVKRGLSVDPQHRFPSIEVLASALREARAQLPRRARVPLVAGTLVLGFGLVALGTRDEPCPIEPSPFTVEQREQVENSLGQGDGTTAFVATVEQWSEQWTRTRRAMCVTARVDGRETEAWLSTAKACTEAQRLDLDALLHAAQGTVDAWKAVDVARRLPSPKRCEDPDAAAMGASTDLELERLRATVRVAAYLGDRAGAQAQLEPLLDSAESTSDAGLRARALAVAGAVAMELHRYDEAARILERATEAAVVAQAPATAAEALITRVQLEGVWRNQPQQARAFAELARTHAEIAGDPRLEAQLEYTLGSLARMREDYREAKTHCERAMQLLDPAASPVRTITVVRMCVADMAGQLGELDEAEAIYARLVEEIVSEFSGEHPLLVGIHNGRGAVALARGDAQAAERDWREALGRASTESDPRVPGMLANLSQALEQQGQIDEARQLLREAIEHARALQGPRGRNVASLLSNLAASYIDTNEKRAARPLLEQAIAALPDDEGYQLTHALIAGNLGLSYLPDDPRAARPHLERARDLATEAVGEHDERVAYQLLGLAECELAEGRPADALVLLDRARAIYDVSDRPEPQRRARLALLESKAVFFTAKTDEDRAQARRLAAQAKALKAEPQAELDAWIELLGQ